MTLSIHLSAPLTGYPSESTALWHLFCSSLHELVLWEGPENFGWAWTLRGINVLKAPQWIDHHPDPGLWVGQPGMPVAPPAWPSTAYDLKTSLDVTWHGLDGKTRAFTVKHVPVRDSLLSSCQPEVSVLNPTHTLPWYSHNLNFGTDQFKPCRAIACIISSKSSSYVGLW